MGSTRARPFKAGFHRGAWCGTLLRIGKPASLNLPRYGSLTRFLPPFPGRVMVHSSAPKGDVNPSIGLLRLASALLRAKIYLRAASASIGGGTPLGGLQHVHYGVRGPAHRPSRTQPRLQGLKPLNHFPSSLLVIQ